jgi:hypothetical protein
MHGRVATGREIIVCSALLEIRGSLIAPTCRLVVIRPRLIVIARDPFAIARRLLELTSQFIPIVRATITTLRRPIAMLRRPIAITCGLIANLSNPTDQKLGATRRTRRSRGHLAASSTRRNLRHRLPPPPSEGPARSLSVVFPHRSTLHRPRPPPG